MEGFHTLTDEQITADPTPVDRSFWSRHKLEKRIAVLILVAWGPAITNSIATYFGYNHGPMLGSPRGIVGAYFLLAFETLAVCALALTWVKPKRMGLFLPRNERPPMRSWVAVFSLATGLLVVLLMLRMVMIDLGLPGNVYESDLPPGVSQMWWDLPWVLRSGFYEEIPMAAMVVLMLRAKWKPSTIMYLIGTLRMLFHIYQGAYSVIPVTLFGIGFAALFIRYRRVGPLIAAHIFYDATMTVLDAVCPGWLNALWPG